MPREFTTGAVVAAEPVLPLNVAALLPTRRPLVQPAPLVSVSGCWPVPLSAAVVPAPSFNAHSPTGALPDATKNRYCAIGDRLPTRSTLRTYRVFRPGAVGVTDTVALAPRLGAATADDGGSTRPYR